MKLLIRQFYSPSVSSYLLGRGNIYVTFARYLLQFYDKFEAYILKYLN
jgi:hypothetical protein